LFNITRRLITKHIAGKNLKTWLCDWHEAWN